jgi:hypothetical protein
MENMLWIEDIVDSKPTPPFFINFKIDMVDFMDSQKVIIKRSAFSTLTSAQNGGKKKKEKNHEKKGKKDQKLS